MIDNLSILLSHALLLYVFYQLIYRDDLDNEAPPPPLQEDDARSRFQPIKLGQKRAKDEDKPSKTPSEKPAVTPRFRQAPKPVGRRDDA